MGRVKRQHYVPQFYLRNFSVDGKERRVWVYDKTQRRSFAVKIRSVASRRSFYDVPEIDEACGVKQAVEKHLQRYEDDAAVAVNSLLGSLRDGSFRGITQEQRISLALYLPLQIIRTAEARERDVQWVAALNRIMFSAWLRQKDPELADKVKGKYRLVLDEEGRKRLHVRHLLDLEHRQELAEMLFTRYWVIQRSPPGHAFITSDHPAVHIGHAKHPWRSMQGLGCPEVELAFPLSSKYLLAIWEESRFPPFARQLLDGHVLDVQPENVEFYNSLQVIFSEQHVFAAESGFSMVEEVIDDHPDLADPARARLQVSGGGEDLFEE